MRRRNQGFRCSAVPMMVKVLLRSFAAAGDWMCGRARIAHCGRCLRGLCSCSYGRGPAIRPCIGEAVLVTATRYMEGCPSPDEALVCGGRCEPEILP